MNAPRVGDYVIASKYQDGDPCDSFAVGFVERVTDAGRVIVVDDRGEPFRASGYRRAERITQDEGRALIELSGVISDKPGESVWWHLARIREARGPSEVYPRFCDSCSDSIYDDEGELIRNPRVEQLRKERDEALARAEKAERERDKAIDRANVKFARLQLFREWVDDDGSVDGLVDRANLVDEIDRLLANPPADNWCAPVGDAFYGEYRPDAEVLSKNDEIERLREERDEALAYCLAVAQAAGVYYEADCMDPVPGPVAEVVAQIERYKDDSKRLTKERGEARPDADRSVVESLLADELCDAKAQLSAALEAVVNAWRGRTAMEAAIARRRW